MADNLLDREKQTTAGFMPIPNDINEAVKALAGLAGLARKFYEKTKLNHRYYILPDEIGDHLNTIPNTSRRLEELLRYYYGQMKKKFRYENNLWGKIYDYERDAKKYRKRSNERLTTYLRKAFNNEDPMYFLRKPEGDTYDPLETVGLINKSDWISPYWQKKYQKNYLRNMELYRMLENDTDPSRLNSGLYDSNKGPEELVSAKFKKGSLPKGFGGKIDFVNDISQAKHNALENAKDEKEKYEEALFNLFEIQRKLYDEGINPEYYGTDFLDMNPDIGVFYDWNHRKPIKHFDGDRTWHYRGFGNSYNTYENELPSGWNPGDK